MRRQDRLRGRPNVIPREQITAGAYIRSDSTLNPNPASIRGRGEASVSVGIRTVWARGHLVACPAGEPTKADCALADAPVAPPAADQVLVRNDWFSVDPYMRSEFDQVVAGESVIMRSITRVTSAMMRSTSPETVGTWWISPCASRVLQIPASMSPVSYTSRPRARDQMADRREIAASSLDREHLRDIPRNRARGDGRQDGEIKAEGPVGHRRPGRRGAVRRPRAPRPGCGPGPAAPDQPAGPGPGLTTSCCPAWRGPACRSCRVCRRRP
jgi:N-terminal domain of oxidoreductase